MWAQYIESMILALFCCYTTVPSTRFTSSIHWKTKIELMQSSCNVSCISIKFETDWKKNTSNVNATHIMLFHAMMNTNDIAKIPSMKMHSHAISWGHCRKFWYRYRSHALASTSEIRLMSLMWMSKIPFFRWHMPCGKVILRTTISQFQFGLCQLQFQ